ncbi:MAG: ABC transporter ATP-binding protein [Bdellovibrionales bacterium]|nr:ABC transporter ATP-binding protein [Bdellovibrionales bacterium]
MKVVFQKLWPEISFHKKIIIGSLLIGIFISALKGVSPELMRRLVQAWTEKDKDLSTYIPLLISLTWIISGIGRYFHLFWMKYTSDRIAVKLRRDLMNKYLSLNLAFFQNFMRGSGGLISRMLTDIQIIQDSIHKLADFIREPFLVIFSLGYLIYLDWKLTIIIIIAIPFVTSILRRMAKSLRKYGHRSQETMEDLTKTLKESLDGTRIVQSFNLEPEMRNRFNKQAENYLEYRRKIVSREEATGPLSESFGSIILALLMWYIGKQIFEGHLKVEDFVGFTFAIILLQDSVKKVQSGYIKLQQAATALERMHQILDCQDVVPQLPAPKTFPSDWQNIEFRNVTFAFGEKPVLNNINLTVRRGEMIALVGASGGGKSTLVNLIQRFFDPNEGDIYIGNVNIKDMSLKDLRDHIALVAQDVFLFGDTIRYNIWAGDLSKDSSGVEDAAKIANAHNFIINTADKYETRLGDQGSRLSGGEKQRISIARAVFKDAPILILDEATSALDSENEREVQKGLDQLMKGRTAFVIAHRLSTIMKADRILVLKNGLVVEEGTHESLMSRQGEYYNYQQLQSSL